MGDGKKKTEAKPRWKGGHDRVTTMSESEHVESVSLRLCKGKNQDTVDYTGGKTMYVQARTK